MKTWGRYRSARTGPVAATLRYPTGGPDEWARCGAAGVRSSLTHPDRPVYNHLVSHSIDWACVRSGTATGWDGRGSPRPAGSDPFAGSDLHAVDSKGRCASDSRRESDCYDSLPRYTSSRERVWPLLLALLVNSIGFAAMASRPTTAGLEETPAAFFTVTEPITSETISGSAWRPSKSSIPRPRPSRGSDPILVFEFRAGESAPGSSEYGACHDLANLISRDPDLAGAKLTVAYVPKPLKGYAVLPAVACTEIVMGSAASLGPIAPEGQSFDADYREFVRFLAIRKTRDPDLLVGMLDRDADLRLIHTADKTVHYVLAENLQAFQKLHQVIDEQPAWEGGHRGVLTAKRAREEGFCKRTADSPAELANIYQISGQSAVDDPTLGQLVRPVWIRWKARSIA